MNKILIAFLLSATALAASADESKPSEAFVGPGQTSCSEYLRRLTEPDEGTNDLFLSWALGYLSAKGSINKFNYKSYWMEAHMRQFCDKNPDAPFVDAVISLSSALSQPFDQ